LSSNESPTENILLSLLGSVSKPCLALISKISAVGTSIRHSQETPFLSHKLSSLNEIINMNIASMFTSESIPKEMEMSAESTTCRKSSSSSSTANTYPVSESDTDCSAAEDASGYDRDSSNHSTTSEAEECEEDPSGCPAHARTTVYHEDVDRTKNPDEVEDLMSKEMMQLSMESRLHIQDEIHGVGCMAPEETPKLLATSLEKMRNELDHVVPLEQKRSYLRAKIQYPRSYVHGDDFKLRFLRYDLFDVSKAAVRMAYFIDLLSDIYGEYALERPIRLSDFSKQELAGLRKGRMQLLAERDRGGAGTGRRIFVIFPDKEWEDMPAEIRHKIFIYIMWVAGKDVDAQRKGLCFVAWFDQNVTPSWKPKFRTQANQLFSVRLSSVHICTPDTPYYKLRRAIGLMTAGRYRINMKVHTGDSMELRYALRSYGFPSERIPITDTGSIKTVNLKKWIRLRFQLEDFEKEDFIYSPYLTDVTFRKGKAMMRHPGNVILRQMIRSKIENGDFDRLKNKTRHFITEVIQDMKAQHESDCRNGIAGMHHHNPTIRLLEWNEVRKDAWKELTADEDMLYSKLRQIVRAIEKSIKEERKTKKFSMVPDENPSTSDQGSATSIFLSQDLDTGPFFCGSSSSSAAALRAVKKQKLDIDGDGKTTLDVGLDALECFGRKFLPLPFTPMVVERQ